MRAVALNVRTSSSARPRRMVSSETDCTRGGWAWNQKLELLVQARLAAVSMRHGPHLAYDAQRFAVQEAFVSGKNGCLGLHESHCDLDVYLRRLDAALHFVTQKRACSCRASLRPLHEIGQLLTWYQLNDYAQHLPA